MKVLLINSVCGIRSTGRICTDIARELESKGHEVRIAYGRVEEVPEQFQKYAVRIGTNFDLWMHALRTRILDEHGFGSKRATREFLIWAERYKPDLLWLHNLHGYYINIEMLFAWIKRHPEMKVKWTLHDCWAFTGHCSYFSYAKCDKWQTSCGLCPQIREYPSSLICDRSKNNYMRKKRAFLGIDNMEIIVPSEWLANLVKRSFLSEYPVKVQYNTIDVSVFKPTQSDFRERYHLEDKKIVLGVASVWSKRKGLQDFIKLSELLDDRYRIVLVGLDDGKVKNLPSNIIPIRRTNRPEELAEIYTAADVFVNPTHEDNFPTVNLEAQACGTRVITYDTGGCAETIWDKSGTVVKRDVFQIYNALLL